MDNGKLELSGFPELQFKPDLSNTNNQIIEEYFNGLLFLSDAIINGRELNYSYDFFISKINEDGQMDQAGKNLLLCGIQLSKKVFTSDVAIEFYNRDKATVELRDACGCDDIYATYVIYLTYCQAGFSQYCSVAQNYYNHYIDCLNKDIHCPVAFSYDGANCHYWGLYFPSDYEPIIWNNTFYVKPKCY